MKRRTFIKGTTLAGLGASALNNPLEALESLKKHSIVSSINSSPLVISTWDMGASVTETAYATMNAGGTVLDAIEQAIRIVEADPKITSVGYGGNPDRDGHVTLDASIMDTAGNCGSVVFLENIMHPISVARLVMEKTIHVLLAGEGAQQFALENGFKKEKLLTPEAEAEWKKWLKTSNYKPLKSSIKNHDTVGLLAMDAKGNLAGGCSTSGMQYKIRGRVGDSPIIGSGLYVDGEVGAATATGIGEAVIKISGSFLIVELMRQGKSPQEACTIAIERLVRKHPKYKSEGFLVGFIAMNKDGEYGGMSWSKGFQYSVCKDGKNMVVDSPYLKK